MTKSQKVWKSTGASGEHLVPTACFFASVFWALEEKNEIRNIVGDWVPDSSRNEIQDHLSTTLGWFQEDLKVDLDEKKLDEDFDKFIKQLDEIDTRPPSKGFKKKNKKIKSSKRTENHKKSPYFTSVGIKKRRATKRKPMPSQPKRKSQRQ